MAHTCETCDWRVTGPRRINPEGDCIAEGKLRDTARTHDDLCWRHSALHQKKEETLEEAISRTEKAVAQLAATPPAQGEEADRWLDIAREVDVYTRDTKAYIAKLEAELGEAREPAPAPQPEASEGVCPKGGKFEGQPCVCPACRGDGNCPYYGCVKSASGFCTHPTKQGECRYFSPAPPAAERKENA